MNRVHSGSFEELVMTEPAQVLNANPHHYSIVGKGAKLNESRAFQHVEYTFFVNKCSRICNDSYPTYMMLF